MENNEMTEREMLEFAAKAAGIKGGFYENHPEDGAPCYSCGIWRGASVKLWNPLTNDGDALRLAVKLGIGFRHRAGGDGSTYPALVTVFTGSFDLTEYVSQSGDAFSATRFAITKAAAEIGKRMA